MLLQGSTMLILSLLTRSSCAFARIESTFGIRRLAGTVTSLQSQLAADNEDDGLPPDLPRRDDVLAALAAVRRASFMTNKLQPESSDSFATVSKQDLSPVTVADFAAQALVLDYLRNAFADDSFIAEESSQPLDDDEELAKLVVNATNMSDLERVKKSIDLGKEYETWKQRPRRVWCLDPIDGTKGFLRGRRDGGQYCVALALLEDGVPTVGVLGCPNLPASPTDFDYAWTPDETFENNQDSRGCIFVASKDGGCYQLSLVPGKQKARRLSVTPNDGSVMSPQEARFCIGVEKFSDALGQCAGMAQLLHGKETALTSDGEIIKARRIDSQAKYGVLARAGAEYYVRLPRPGYVEWIWDHAAGFVVITEAGGVMTDTDGNLIDFGLGASMSNTVKGVMGSNGGQFHEALLKAFKEQEIARLKALE